MNDSNSVPEKDSLIKTIKRNLALQRIASLFKRAYNKIRQSGWQALWREIDFRVRLLLNAEYWRYKARLPLKKELKAQRKTKFENAPLISVVVPLYNTPHKFFKQLLKSIIKQSYQNYELVLVDAGREKLLPLIPKKLLFHTRGAKTPYIKYISIDENLGIAGNSNIGIENTAGDYICLVDHDDVLVKSAFYEIVNEINENKSELIYTDEVVLQSNLKKLHSFHFKPDYAPYTLLGCNYITHLCVFSRQLLEKTGFENTDYDGAQDYDFILRLTENTEKIAHIAKVLYFWRVHENSTAGGIDKKGYAVSAGENAINAYLQRNGIDGGAKAQEEHPGSYRLKINTPPEQMPLLSIIIPNMEHKQDLERCVNSIFEKGTKINYEIIIVENNSKSPEIFEYYATLEKEHSNVKIVKFKGGFNFSAICNFGFEKSKGKQIMLLNNDIEIISENFFEELISLSMLEDVGAVGPLLYYPDKKVQHAGLIIGIGGTAGGSHKGHPQNDGGLMFRLCTVQNISAVTGACLVVKRSLYKELGGLDEESFAVAFNDVDFCLRLRHKGLNNLFTPYAEAWHYESKSRGYDNTGAANERFLREAAAFKEKYKEDLQKGDPYYNVHFTLEYENFALA